MKRFQIVQLLTNLNMKIEELEKYKLMHKLKNKPMVLRHKTTRSYFIYIKKMGNGYHKIFKECGDITYFSTEYLTQHMKYAFSQDGLELELGNYQLTDYLTYDYN